MGKVETIVRVMAVGVFDILHPGHLYYLREAKKLGDELVVVVARDSTVRKQKHEPITPENMRLEMIKALKVVDDAVLGYEDDFYKVVEEIRPDIIALGYDQHHDPLKIRDDLKLRGLDVKVTRLSKYCNDLDGTRKIIGKIIDLWSFHTRISKIEKNEKDRYY